MNCVAVFYDKFRERIAGIKTTNERIGILSDMEVDFQNMVRNEPEKRDSLSEAYETLKLKCWEVAV